MQIIKGAQVYLLSLFVIGTVTGCSFAARNTGPSGFQPMADEVIVFFRMKCSMGTVSWITPRYPERTATVCGDQDPGLVVLKIRPGRYDRLVFRDAGDRREWKNWIFSAPLSGIIYYWGDIDIITSLARIENNQQTVKEFREKYPKLAERVVEYGVRRR